MNKKFLVFSSHILILISVCSSFDLYTKCSEKFRCGETEAEFPFWGGTRPQSCGYPNLKLDCERNKAMISIKNVKYQVLNLNQESQTLKIARADFIKGSLCSPRYGNTSLDSEIFEYSLDSSSDVTLLYGCSSNVNFYLSNEFKCPNEKGFVLFGNPGNNGAGSCRLVVTVRVVIISSGDEEFNVSSVEEGLEEGFDVKYIDKVDDDERCGKCKSSGGVCGYDLYLNRTTCYCSSISGSVSTCSSGPGYEGQVDTNGADNKSGTYDLYFE